MQIKAFLLTIMAVTAIVKFAAAPSPKEDQSIQGRCNNALCECFETGMTKGGGCNGKYTVCLAAAVPKPSPREIGPDDEAPAVEKRDQPTTYGECLVRCWKNVCWHKAVDRCGNHVALSACAEENCEHRQGMLQTQ